MNATASRNGGLDSDEEERLLSEQYGEASDDDPTSSKRKRRENGPVQQETVLTEEDAAAAKEFEEKMRRKKARPTLTATELKGERGLVYVRRSFPTTVQRFREPVPSSRHASLSSSSSIRARRSNAKARIDAAARYSRSLVSAYREFGRELFPSLAVEDVFLKIEDLGKKKEVKDYLQIMREESRREHLEGIYGGERAGRILTELQHGSRSMMMGAERSWDARAKDSEEDGGEGAVAPRMGRAVNWEDEGTKVKNLPRASVSNRVAVSNPYAKNVQENDDEPPEDASPKSKADGEADDAAPGEPTTDAVVADQSSRAGEENEEEEATFSASGDDDANGVASPTAAAEEENDADNADEATGNVTAERDDDAKEGDDINADDPPEPATEKEDDVVEKAVASDAEVGSPDDATNESTPRLRTQESTVAAPDLTANATGESVPEEKIEPPAQETTDGQTQETLTLVVESQFDDDDDDDDVSVEYTQDERFSQAATDATTREGGGAAEDPTRGGSDGGGGEGCRDDDDRFSQSQDDRFSQGKDDDDAGDAEGEDDDERFSQFAEGSGTAGDGPIFEEDGCGDLGAIQDGSDALGQTMNTQLTMEY